MKKNITITLLAILLIGFVAGISGCVTGALKIKITPMKVEINAPDVPKASSVPSPIELITK